MYFGTSTQKCYNKFLCEFYHHFCVCADICEAINFFTSHIVSFYETHEKNIYLLVIPQKSCSGDTVNILRGCGSFKTCVKIL